MLARHKPIRMVLISHSLLTLNQIPLHMVTMFTSHHLPPLQWHLQHTYTNTASEHTSARRSTVPYCIRPPSTRATKLCWVHPRYARCDHLARINPSLQQAPFPAPVPPAACVALLTHVCTPKHCNKNTTTPPLTYKAVLTCNLLCCWLLASICCCQCALVCVRLKAHRLHSLIVQVQAERNACMECTLQGIVTAQ